MDNAVAGSIYVVSGRIRGAPGSDRASQKSLGIRLFDTTGREIDRAPIPLGPAVPERILRESSKKRKKPFAPRDLLTEPLRLLAELFVSRTR